MASTTSFSRVRYMRTAPRPPPRGRWLDALSPTQTDDQPIAVAVIGRRQETLGLDGPRHVENDTQLARGPPAHAHLFDHPGTGWGGARPARQPCARDLEDHA